jgi:hypothetical protein
MKRTVITAALLAAFAIPAFAEDASNTEEQITAAKASTENVIGTQDDAAQTSMQHGRSDCMKRYSTTQNMM